MSNQKSVFREGEIGNTNIQVPTDYQESNHRMTIVINIFLLSDFSALTSASSVSSF